MSVRLRRILFAAFFSIPVLAFSQQVDTLKLSLQEAEKIFLQNNLPLIIEKLNINQADARILQAKVWPNPQFTLEEVQLFVDGTTEEIPPLFGNFWRDRNVAAQLEQLVYTAGKRRKTIALEMRNKDLAETAFTDLLQALKTEFRQNMAELLYLQKVQGGYDFQLAEVNKLLKAQELQLKQGNISQVELYRLKALQISLQGEVNGLHEDITEKQMELKTLMFLEPKTYLVVADENIEESVQKLKQYNLQELITLSDNNAGLKATRDQIKISEAQLAIEKANKVPDLNLKVSYDRQGSVMRNFVGLGVSLDLPLFDRNKGNIKEAQFELEKSVLTEKQKVSELNNTVFKKWTDLNKSIQLYEKIDKDYLDKLEGMSQSIAKSFQQHHLSLLEFLDFFESFRESKEKYYESLKNIILKKEDLNYLIGGEL